MVTNDIFERYFKDLNKTWDESEDGSSSKSSEENEDKIKAKIEICNNQILPKATLSLMNGLIDNINNHKSITIDEFMKIKFRKSYPAIVSNLLDYVWNYIKDEDELVLDEFENEILKQIADYSEKYNDDVLEFTTEKFYFC